MFLPPDITVEVTAEDIANGARKVGGNCPIARAIRRATGCSDVFVTADAIVAGEIYELPSEAEDFIWAFDGGQDVTPFTFTARR
jgi:hypothetical protein